MSIRRELVRRLLYPHLATEEAELIHFCAPRRSFRRRPPSGTLRSTPRASLAGSAGLRTLCTLAG